MLTQDTFKIWYLVHKWTSLICTVFLLLLCLTGLPMIFAHDIDRLLGHRIYPPEMPGYSANMDRMVEVAKARRPGEFVRTVFQPQDTPGAWVVSMGLTPDAIDSSFLFWFDARTGELLLDRNPQEGVMHVVDTLHVELFAGLPGTLFLGFMGLLFVASIVSGVVVYGPHMSKLRFGTVRRERGARLKWLDLHNLLGIVTVGWLLVVGFTGVVNTLARPAFSYWKSTELAAMTAPWRGKPAPTTFASLDRAVQTARTAEPTMQPAFVAFPGQVLAGNHHYGVFMRGNTPLTSRLMKPVLIDVETGELTAKRDMPWYVTALKVSQPLHFGNYGGLPLQIIWTVLDLITIIVLGSGLYLWWVRRKISVKSRFTEIERTEAEVTTAVSAKVAATVSKGAIL